MELYYQLASDLSNPKAFSFQNTCSSLGAIPLGATAGRHRMKQENYFVNDLARGGR